MIYIAAPFFNREQILFVEEIENALKNKKLKYFSPMREGVILKDLSPKERQLNAKKVYSSNINGIIYSHAMIAVIDDFDPGTIFEIGYGTCYKEVSGDAFCVITLTKQNYGLNVMLSQAIDAHTLSIEQAILAYKEWYVTGKIIVNNSLVTTTT